MTIIDPVNFAHRAGQLGITLPEAAMSTVERLSALDTAIRNLTNDPLSGIDITTLQPDRITVALYQVIRNENRSNARHSNAVHRFRTTLASAANMAIRDHADDILIAIRSVHDPIADQLADDAELLADIDAATLATVDAETVIRWTENATAKTIMRQVQAVRTDLAEIGYRLHFRDIIGRELEQLTRFVDVPIGADRTCLTALYDVAERHNWSALLRTGCTLWMPTLAEQADRIEALRPALARRSRTPTPAP